MHVPCSEVEKVIGTNTNCLCFALRSSLTGPLSTFQTFFTFTCCHNTNFGKIQGDGRKFLDSFKSYFGSQISSQSLNEVHIYQLQPKSATKDDFFYIFLSLTVSSWRHGLQMANEADEVLLGKRPR